MNRCMETNQPDISYITTKVFKIMVNYCKSNKKSFLFNHLEELDDNDDQTTSYDTEHDLRSLYGSLSSVMQEVHAIYQSRSSRLQYVTAKIDFFQLLQCPFIDQH